MSERDAERDAKSTPKKPGWRILADSAGAILNLTEEEWATADTGTLAENLLRQVWSRLEEIIPEEHEGAVVFEVLRAVARVAEVPFLSPNTVDFVVDRTSSEDLEVMLREGLRDEWRLVQFAEGELAPTIVQGILGRSMAVIVESTVAESMEKFRSLVAEGEPGRNEVMLAYAAILGAIMSGPYGGRIMDAGMYGRGSGMGTIMGDPIVVGPGEGLGDALPRAMPGYEVIEVGGPHADLLEALLGRRGSGHGDGRCGCGNMRCPGHADEPGGEETSAEPPVAPATPAEDPFGDQ